MVSVLNNKTCVQDGCTTQAYFGVAGTKKKEYCAKHAKGGMVNVCTRAIKRRKRSHVERTEALSTEDSLKRSRRRGKHMDEIETAPDAVESGSPPVTQDPSVKDELLVFLF